MRPNAASSDPSLPLRRRQQSQAVHEDDIGSAEEEEDDGDDDDGDDEDYHDDDDDDDDDDEHGVHVDVIERGQGYDVNFTPEGVGGGRHRGGRR